MVMKKELHLGWRRVKPISAYVNATINISLRKIFAIKLIEAMQQGRNIISFDESSFTFMNNTKYFWAEKGKPCRKVFPEKISNITLMLAVTAEGHKFYAFLKGTNNQASFLQYLSMLVE